MNGSRLMAVACLLLLMNWNSPAFSQVGSAKTNKKVTVTLVRWPYT